MYVRNTVIKGIHSDVTSLESFEDANLEPFAPTDILRVE